jgi:hypothetical protein
VNKEWKRRRSGIDREEVQIHGSHGCRGVDDIFERLSREKRPVNETCEITPSILYRIVRQTSPVDRQRKQELVLSSCRTVKHEIRDRG